MDDLFRIWADADYCETARSLGYPSVSPSFRHLGGGDDSMETWEPGPHEVRAVLEAMAWLATHHAALYTAACRRYKRGPFGHPQPGDHALVTRAAKLLEQKVNEILA
jgi:hypothetical protein